MIGYKPPHALLRPRIALPFLLVALIWGSTWFVIKDQLPAAPLSWSVTYRIAIAAAGMFALAAALRQGFGMTLPAHLVAMLIGLLQFSLNFNFVYRAELDLTSGLVAVLFGLQMLPNAVLGRAFLGQTITPRFLLGTLVAVAGIALLLVHEANEAPPGGRVSLGILLTVAAIASVAVANVLQATVTATRHPVLTLLAWSMLWGALFNAAFAGLTAGAPVFPDSSRYWAAVAYLAIVGSVVTFPLYIQLIRDLGPGRAAYNGVLVPVVAMAISTLLEGYRWSALAVTGAAFALLGMIVALRGREAPVSNP